MNALIVIMLPCDNLLTSRDCVVNDSCCCSSELTQFLQERSKLLELGEIVKQKLNDLLLENDDSKLATEDEVISTLITTLQQDLYSPCLMSKL